MKGKRMVVLSLFIKKPIKKKFKCECGEIVCIVDSDEPQEYCPICGKKLSDNGSC